MQALAGELKEPFFEDSGLAQLDDQSIPGPTRKFPKTVFTAGLDLSIFTLMDPEVCREKDLSWDHARLIDTIISEFSELNLLCGVSKQLS